MQQYRLSRLQYAYACLRTLSECEVALVRQRCVHQFGGIALILIGILESSINHTDGALVAFKVEPLQYRDNGILVPIKRITYKVTRMVFTLKLVQSRFHLNRFTKLPNLVYQILFDFTLCKIQIGQPYSAWSHS